MRIKLHTIMAIAVLTFLSAACAPAPPSPTVNPTAAPQPTSDGMGDMPVSVQSMDFAPPVTGYYAGEEIVFIHTEASDPEVADMLTAMMGPQVVLVSRLAETPASLLAEVYVFTNGVQGNGPFGFQPDVFDAVPGDEGYSPLRAINLVAWQENVPAQELRSAEEVKAAESRGEVAIVRPGIVVNMPILSWPGGHR